MMKTLRDRFPQVEHWPAIFALLGMLALTIAVGAWMWTPGLIEFYKFLGMGSPNLGPAEKSRILFFVLIAAVVVAGLKEARREWFGLSEIVFAGVFGWNVIGTELTNNRAANLIPLLAVMYLFIQGLENVANAGKAEKKRKLADSSR